MNNWEEERNKIIGLGENSFKKSYYPELQKKLDELEVSSRNLQKILNSMSDAVIIHDYLGKILYFNNQAYKIYNLNEQEITQYTFADISSENMNIRELHKIWKEIDLYKTITIDWTTRQPGTNKEFSVQMSINPINWNGISALIAVVRDFSERMKTELVLRESEQRFRLLMEQAVDGIFLGDSVGNFIGVNSTGAEMTGYSKEELMAMNMGQLFTEEEKKRTPLRYDLLMEGKVVLNERALKRKDGTTLPIEMRTKMMPDKTYQSFFRDITERKQNEETLHESEEKYRLIFEYSPLGLLSFDEKGLIVACNDNFVQIIGSSREKLIGLNMLNLPDKNIVYAVREALNGNLGSYEGTYSSITAKKSTPVRCLFAPKNVGAGGISGGVGIIEDISERKKAELALHESEEKYRSVIESAPFGIFIIKDELIHYVNPVMHKITGYTELDVIGKHFSNFVAKKYRETEQQFYARRMKGEVFPSTYETSAIIKNGTEIPVELTAAIFNLFGEKAEMVFVRDITERKEAERIQLQNKRELDSIYNTVGDMVFQLQVEEGSRFRFNSVNRTFENYSGLSASVVVGKLLNEIIAEPVLSIDIEKCQEAIEQKAIVRWERTSQFRAEMLTCEYSVGPVFDKEEKCTHIVGSIHDITERKMVEERIKKLNEELEDRVKRRTKQLEDVNKELEAFAYSVSHDLRAPLRAINGFARILIEDYATKIDDEGHRVCGVIQTEAVRMGRLIDDLLSFSRLSRSTLQTSRIDMKQLVQQVFLELIKQSHPAEIDFILHDLPKIDGDLNLLRQVWINLLSNAIKFTSKIEKPRIEVACIEKESENIFSITDNGAGFDIKYVDKLFGVFQRLHTLEEFDGTGVGLAIVQRIIYRHGGRAWAEGTVGQGATFYFSLPNKKNHEIITK